MNRVLLWIVGMALILFGLSHFIGFTLALDLTLLVGAVAGGILFYQWVSERRRLKRRHQAEGMSGWEVRLPYGEKESTERMTRLIGYSGKFDSFVLAYVGSSVEDRNNSTKVVVEFRYIIDPRQAQAARSKILQEYPDAFVTEVKDEATEQLIARYLELHPYLPISEIIRQKLTQVRGARQQLQAS